MSYGPTEPLPFQLDIPNPFEILPKQGCELFSPRPGDVTNGKVPSVRPWTEKNALGLVRLLYILAISPTDNFQCRAQYDPRPRREEI